MHPDVRTALSLQDIDHRITELQREIAGLPKQVAEIENQLASHIKKLEIDKAAAAANLRDRKTFEGEIQTQQQKISKLRDQMTGAKITNEQYRAFQHEIEYCEQAIRKAEDRILDLMAEYEPLDRNVKEAELALAAEKKVVESEKAKAAARTDEDKAELAKQSQQRAEFAAKLPKPLLTTYERLRAKLKDGQAVVEVKNETCLGCRMKLRPQHFEIVKRAAEVQFCESCRRIVFYAPPERFDSLIDTPVQASA